MRRSGILMPVFSLPSQYGIGCFSKEAYQFVDFLKDAGQTYWQILPLGPTGYGDSPYQAFSTFAGNPYFIDLNDLAERGYIGKEELETYDFGGNEEYIDYEKLYTSRFQVLRKAYANSHIADDCKFKAFCDKNDYWLTDYALYMAIKGTMDNQSYDRWPDELRTRKQNALKAFADKNTDDILFYKFQQYMFYEQWMRLKKYANENGIEIIGDIPIYVALDSADTWSNPSLFQFDNEGKPKAVAGCPPDAFSETGQLWGNPLYDWEYHRKTGYDWWLRRIAYCFELYDVVRIDHFRGFDEYYAIPYGDKTAEFGHWEKGPGYDLFKEMKEKLGDKHVIAEDLGFLTKSVIRLLKRTGYPGMKVLQFAFDASGESNYLPHNYDKNCVVYTGTHDNDTTPGWYAEMPANDKKFAKQYLNFKGNKNCELHFIRAALASVAETAIIPMQDYIGAGSEARINHPSTIGANWKWRMKNTVLSNSELSKEIFEMNRLYGRN